MKRVSLQAIGVLFVLGAFALGCESNGEGESKEAVSCVSTDDCPVGEWCVEVDNATTGTTLRLGVCSDTCTRTTQGCTCGSGGVCGLNTSGQQLACVDGLCEVPRCPAGSAGCGCDEGTCGDGLECSSSSGVERCEVAGCTAGEEGCTCRLDRTCDGDAASFESAPTRVQSQGPPPARRQPSARGKGRTRRAAPQDGQGVCWPAGRWNLFLDDSCSIPLHPKAFPNASWDREPQGFSPDTSPGTAP